MAKGKIIPKWKKDRIIQLHKEGLNQSIISERMGINQGTISVIIRGWRLLNNNKTL